MEQRCRRIWRRDIVNPIAPLDPGPSRGVAVIGLGSTQKQVQALELGRVLLAQPPIDALSYNVKVYYSVSLVLHFIGSVFSHSVRLTDALEWLLHYAMSAQLPINQVSS